MLGKISRLPNNAALSGKKEQAAVLVAQDDLTDRLIAESVGVTEMTLYRWKTRDEAFKARIAEVRVEIAAVVLNYGIARKENRIRAKDRRWRACQTIAAEREGKELTDRFGHPVPGGKTGWLHPVEVMTSRGPQLEYQPDEKLNDMMSKLENDTAKELGQLTERVQTTVTVRRLIGVDIDEL